MQMSRNGLLRAGAAEHRFESGEDMQSAEDRRRLVRQYGDVQPKPLAVVLKCVAGIATLFAVAAGPWVVLSADTPAPVADVATKAVASYPDSMAESRRLYETRRARAESREEATKAALAK